jgi:hypothetical protein
MTAAMHLPCVQDMSDVSRGRRVQYIGIWIWRLHHESAVAGQMSPISWAVFSAWIISHSTCLAQQPRYVQRASQIFRIFFNAVTTGAWIHGSVGWFSAWTQEYSSMGQNVTPNSKRSFAVAFSAWTQSTVAWGATWPPTASVVLL